MNTTINCSYYLINSLLTDIMSNQTDYKNIFKSTFLFGFVQVFNILVKIGTNKAVAIFLGAEGMGIIGLFNASINLLKIGGGLGVSESAVRDISEANGCGDQKRFSRIISLTNKVILFTCLLGSIITIILSPWLSKWTFGDESFTLAFMWLALVVGMNILTEGQLAILKGMRQLRALAKASMIGSVIGLVTAVPFYFFFGKAGIVPSLIITAISALVFSNYFVRRIKYEHIKITIKELYNESSSLVKMGIALMTVAFLGSLSDLIISSYISNHGGLDMVGYYSVGITIISGYFGIIITAMSTDYYPRISAIHANNEKLQEEVNRQSEVGLVLVAPVVILFILISPLIVRILYSSQFTKTIEYTDYAVLGVIITICSNSLGMILLAKQNAIVFVNFSIIVRIFVVFISITMFNLYGLLGLGISYIINAIINIIPLSIFMYYSYHIKFSLKLYMHLLLILLLAVIALFSKHLDNQLMKYSLGMILLIISTFYSYYIMKKNMNLSIINIFRGK